MATNQTGGIQMYRLDTTLRLIRRQRLVNPSQKLAQKMIEMGLDTDCLRFLISESLGGILVFLKHKYDEMEVT